MLSSKASSILASAARPSSRVTGAGKVSFPSPSASGTSVVDNDMVDVGRLQLNVCIKIGEAAYPTAIFLMAIWLCRCRLSLATYVVRASKAAVKKKRTLRD